MNSSLAITQSQIDSTTKFYTCVNIKICDYIVAIRLGRELTFWIIRPASLS